MKALMTTGPTTHHLAPRTAPAAVQPYVRVQSHNEDLAEKKVFQSKSMYGDLIVQDKEGLRTLSIVKNGVETSINKYDPQDAVVEYMILAAMGIYIPSTVQRALLIGVGGGVFMNMVHDVWPHAVVEGVEIDPLIVDVAYRYFGLSRSSNVRSIIDDGARFVAKAGDRYDLVFIDAFDKDDVPSQIASPECVSRIRDILTEGGLAMFNVDVAGHMSLRAHEVFLSTFSNAFRIDVHTSNNSMLFGGPALTNRPKWQARLKMRAAHLPMCSVFLSACPRHTYTKERL